MRSRAPLFGALAAVLLAVGFWFLLYQPKSDEQAALETETAQLESQAADLRLQIERLEEIKDNQVTYKAQLAKLEEYIPVGDTAQPAILRQFQLTADASGVEIMTVTFGDPVPVEGAPETVDADTALATIPTSMTVEGGYFQLVDFFRRLEVDVPRALLVESVNVAEAEDGFPVLSTAWAGDLFAVVPVEAAAPPPPAPGTTPSPGATTAPSPRATSAPSATAPDAPAADADAPVPAPESTGETS